jgi:hypothetical protein
VVQRHLVAQQQEQASRLRLHLVHQQQLARQIKQHRNQQAMRILGQLIGYHSQNSIN